MCDVAATALTWLREAKWFWQAVVSGVTIAAVLAGLEWLQSSWRQRDQITHLRQIIEGSYRGMLATTGRSLSDGERLLREIYDHTARQLDEVLEHGSPDLHYRRRVAIRQAHAVLAQHFATAAPLDFATKQPSLHVYEEEFFGRFEKLAWLNLDLGSIRAATPPSE